MDMDRSDIDEQAARIEADGYTIVEDVFDGALAAGPPLLRET